MRIFFVINETSFYHPHFLAKFLQQCDDDVVGAAVVSRTMQRNGIEQYLSENLRFLRPLELARLAHQKYGASMKDFLLKRNRSKVTHVGPFHSVESILRYSQIDCFNVESDINQSEYLDRIREKDIDVLVSSNSLVFEHELLAIPKFCCLNRHSSLLPSYAGLFPVFHAYRNGEPHTGVSVHVMGSNIDRCIVLAHRKIPIGSSNTVADLYDKCFDLSSEVLIESLDKVRNNDFSADPGADEPSYFSVPDPSHWREFRARGGRIV